MAETPKEIFLSHLLALINKFEAETGVEIHEVSINRVVVDPVGHIVIPTIIGSVEMNLK